MVIVGVVGGIGSGKSAVCRWVANQAPDVRVIDADRDGHRALETPAVRQKLVDAFGEAILTAEGRISRRAVAAAVFGDAPEKNAAREVLESIVHPAIDALREEQLREFASQPDIRVVLLDAAVLLEAGWKDDCNVVVFVDVSREIQLERIRARGWTDDELFRREASQWPLAKKRENSDFVVDNSGTLDNAGRQMYEYIQRLVAMASK